MAFVDNASRLVDICIEFVCQSFESFVQQVPEDSGKGGITLRFGSTCVLPPRVVEQMLTRLNLLDKIDDCGLQLLRHPGVSGSLKRIHLPGSSVGMTGLLSSIVHFDHLTEVNLAFCRCLPASCRVLEHLLASAQHLMSLKLNFLSGDLAFEFLPLFTAVKDLDLTATQLTTDHLAKAIETMHLLESLDVSSTMVTLLGGLRAASSLENVRSLGLHDLAVSEITGIDLASDMQSELVSSLRALRKLIYLDVSNPSFTSGSTLTGESLLNAVLTAPPAVTEINVSNIASNSVLLKQLEMSPLLPQLTYVGCVALDWASSIASIQLETVAPHVLVGSLFCRPEHASNVLRSEYLKRPLLLSCLLDEDFAEFLFNSVEDYATWSRVGELALSALWLYRHDVELFASAVYMASYFLYRCSELPQFFSLVRRYVEFVANCFDNMIGVEQLCLQLLNYSMQAVRRRAGLSLQIATCLIHALKNFDSKMMSCTELSLLQCLQNVESWNEFSVRSSIGFDLGAVELLITRLECWSQASIDERAATYTQLAIIVTELLADLTDGILDSGQHMLKLLPQVDCIQSLLVSLDAFSYNEAVIWGILCIFGNMAEDVEGRAALLHQPLVVRTGIKHLGITSSGDMVSLAACHLISVLLGADECEWTDGLESRASACQSLVGTLVGLEVYPHQPRNIGYTSIKPLLDMLQCQQVAEVRCFGMWMLASMCNCPRNDHYYKCLGENGQAGLETVCRADFPSDMPKVFCDVKGDIISGYNVWFEQKQ